MKIRRIEIQGFKSFADRTVLRFGEGITGIVGPNGCGKSNIVDAIRWVMGEQSAKHLRGAGMQDVIFAGSEARGPQGFAEVTLTFKNDGALVPPEYAEYSEISTTRRLFRDGTSEYAINKVPCRLRDILELFMGTGVGKNAYSIIEQGRIGLIVTAKPEDRRAFIEDAAGISRYKARRKQAERRIQATEQNLLRVTDITTELGQRLGSLERQAKKAEKYKAIKTELKELELHHAAHRTLELAAQERFEAQQAQDLKSRIHDDQSSVEKEDARIRAALRDLEERQESLRTRENQIAEHQQALALANNNADFLARERDKLVERRAEAEDEQGKLRAELETLYAERDAAENLGDELNSTEDQEGAALGQTEQELNALGEQIDARQEDVEKDKKLVVNALTAIAQHQNNLVNLEKQGADLEIQIGRALTAKKAAAARGREATKSAEQVRAKLDENRQLKLTLEDWRIAHEELLERLRGELLENEGLLLASREELMDKRSRLNSLLEIQKNYEGCKDGVRSIMTSREEGSELGVSLHGLVADVVSAETRYEAAVEAVLGDRLQYVIVGDQNDGIASIDYLKKNAQGRSSFIPLDLREDHVSWAPRPSSRPPGASSAPPRSAVSHPAPSGALAGAHPEVVAEAEAVPGTEAAAQPPTVAMENADAEPVGHEHLAQALSQWFGHARGHGITDLPADSRLPIPETADSVFYAEDPLWPDLQAPGVCGKMVDLVQAQPGFEHVARVLLGDIVVVEELGHARKLWRENGHRKTLVTLSGEILDPVGVITGGSSDAISAGMLAQKREIKDLADQVRMLDAKTTMCEQRHMALKGRIGDLEKTVARLSKEGHQEELSIVNLERDLKRLEEETHREADEVRSLGEEIEMLRKKRAQLAEDGKRSKARVDELELEREAAQKRSEEKLADVEALRQQARDVASRLTQLKVTVAANAERRDSSRKNLNRILQRIVDVDERLERLQEVVVESADEVERLAERIESAKTEGSSLEQVLESERATVETLRAQLAQEDEALRAQDEETRARRKSLDIVKEALGEALMKARETEIARETLAEQIFERYRLTIDSIVSDFHLAALQSDEHRQRVLKLRKQIDNIGAINLTAIDEFNEVNERYQFLSTQQLDLEAAIESLQAAIRRINKTSRERYIEAFRLVNEKFQLVFPKLFNGGHAALILTDESDPLESGIEILAQPPGKKRQSVSLMSGGEKALTAVALIFSIFLIKPTPFCLLDEVDAPLDEANVGRYNDMVADMAGISQFILITHNKRTMELPDRLYGVTMETPGISKIVPVDVVESPHLKAVS